jgi:hypothetical protein
MPKLRSGIRASLLAEILLTTAKTKVRFKLFVVDLDVLEILPRIAVRAALSHGQAISVDNWRGNYPSHGPFRGLVKSLAIRTELPIGNPRSQQR